MDETREQLLRDRQQRGEAPQIATEQDLYDHIRFRAVLAKQFHAELVGLGFTNEEAVIITAGQHF